MTCYGIRSTERSVKTACEKWLRRCYDWTTAARCVDCPTCIASDAWRDREGRFGIGDATVQVHEEIAMEPANRGTRFNMTRGQRKTLEETG